MDTLIAICTVVAAVASVIGVGLGFYALYHQLRRGRQEDEPRLSVQVNPVSIGEQLVAQIRVLNEGRRPVHLIAWYYAADDWLDGDANACVYPDVESSPFPVILEEQQPLDFRVRLDDAKWREMTAIGVQDRMQRHWSAPADNIARFKRVALQVVTLTAVATES